MLVRVERGYRVDGMIDLLGDCWLELCFLPLGLVLVKIANKLYAFQKLEMNIREFGVVVIW